MFARYQINLSTIDSASSASTINIPISMEYQLVDQAELIEDVFVKTETENSVNPIIDYEKTRFLPLAANLSLIEEVTYLVDLSGSTTYRQIGFTDDDIMFNRENFKQTFLNLNFYDTDNPLTQNLITNITLYAQLKESDLLPIGTTTGIPGQPKRVDQILISFVLQNPKTKPKGFSEGYHIYDYKDLLKEGEFKYLYMRASFKNAKTGRATNLMVKDTTLPIDKLVHELYTRYILFRTNTGYYYKVDDLYNGNGGSANNNVTFSNNSVQIKLYQIKVV